jgi:hypothetical protein
VTQKTFETKKAKSKRLWDAWQAKNADKLRAKDLTRYWSDPEKSKQKKAEWAAKNKEKLAAYQRRVEPIWRNANREKVRAQNTRWRIKNKDRIAFLAMNRIARKKAAIPDGYDLRVIKPIYEWCARVTRCLGIQHHVDHVMPLARGGLHHHSNLQVLPATLNAKKSALLGVSLPAPYRSAA